ncbi:MAG: Ig-like domain-containing protein [Gemmatimonadaceae bacterium]|nr:Ig-like domain-containing protein [Gemmatimonadaceae bacterium]
MTRHFRLVFSLLLGPLAAACEAGSEPDAQVATVVVEPGSATLSVAGGVGETLPLAATALDADGGVLTGRAFAWSSGNTSAATVSSAGLVTAVAAGSATISASSEGQMGSSIITVEEAPAADWLFAEDFEDDNWAARGWYDNGAFTTSTTVSHNGSRSLMAQMNAGATNAPWGAGRVLFTPTTTLYISFWVRYSDNWVGSGGTSHPHEILILTTENGAFNGPARTRLTVYVEHNYQNGGFPTLAWQDGENIDEGQIGVDLTGTTQVRAVAGCNGNPDGVAASCYTVGPQHWNWKQLRTAAPRFMPSAGAGYKGDWHHVEAYYALNTLVGGIPQNDGIARYWFDGELALERTDLQFRTGQHPNMRFNQFMISPYIGPGSPVTQTIWYDELRLGTARP